MFWLSLVTAIVVIGSVTALVFIALYMFDNYSTEALLKGFGMVLGLAIFVVAFFSII